MDQCSAVSLSLLFGQDSLSFDLVLLCLHGLDLISLLFQIARCTLVKEYVSVVVTGVHAAGNCGLTAVTSVVSVCHAANWAYSDVFVEEFRCGEVCEDLTVVNTIVVLVFTLLERIKLSQHDRVHALEHIDEVLGLLLEQCVFRQGSEFLIATSRPVLNLIIDNVNLFESLLDVSVITIDSLELLVHLDELSIIRVRCRRIIVISRVNLKLLKSLGELLIILLKVVNLGLTGRDSLEKCCVCLLSDLEATNHSLDISHTCVRLDLLESVIDGTGRLHFLVHLSLHKVIPELVNVQVVSHLELS